MKAPTRLVSEYHSIITIAATVTLLAYMADRLHIKQKTSLQQFLL